jgi:uncharacterized protein (TIGR02145 family)
MKNKFWFYSLILVGLVVLICNSCKKEKDSPSNLVKDTVTVGTQTWMVENLKTTRYNDGTAIPLVTKSVAWETLSTPGYCWYNNDESTYKAPYGALYNWYTVNTGKLCPTGWHVPGDSEWIVLIDFLGGPDSANQKLKEAGTSHWVDPNAINPNADATNQSGFTALPGGERGFLGKYNYIGSDGYWWSSTEGDNDNAWSWSTHVNGIWIGTYNRPKQNGVSVRCLKD